MKPTIQLDIVSLEANIFSGPVEMVVVTSVLGELGILPGHAPLLTQLSSGQIRLILPPDQHDAYYITGGLLEVQADAVTILADTAAHAADLDEAAAIAARENAKRALATQKTKTDYTNALIQISQATAKLRAINFARKGSKKGR